MTWTIDTASQAVAEARQRFAQDVQFYLTQDPRQLPSRYLYDALGSALFEAICELPWYAPTRAEARLLERHAAEILAADAALATIVELGSGSGEKLAMLLVGGETRRALDVHLIDISAKALTLATRTLEVFQHLRVTTHETTYEAGLARFRAGRAAQGRALALFLGSNIGNFDPPAREALLRNIRAALRPGDALVLGVDLVKPEPELLCAYDDPLGVTAAFNRNLLTRINRELGGNFDLEGFAHRAVWNRAHARVEMHLVSRRAQRIRIADAQLEFAMAAGETIWTESSYKFVPEQIAALLGRCSFCVTAQWIDQEGQFALTRAEAI